MSGPPRNRGRGRGRGFANVTQTFGQQSADADMNMSDARPFVPRGPRASRGQGRGGYQGNQNNFQQNHFNQNQNQFSQGQQNQNKRSGDDEGDQTMYDANASRGRGGRGRGRGRGQYQPPHQRHDQDTSNPERSALNNDAGQLLKDFLARRYDAAHKLLNLTAIESDDAIREAGLFATDVTRRKFFPALMVMVDDMLPNREEKIQAIESVTLCNNNLQNTHIVYKLCWSLNHIKNLDLSNNAFASVDALQPWNDRFRQLEHLIVDPFPSSGWETQITTYFPKLKLLNGVQVRGPQATSTGAPVATNQNASPFAPPASNTPQPQALDAEQQRKEEMILYVQQETNLNRDYALQLLEAANWDIAQAGTLFTQSQPTLPPQAYN